MAIGCLLPRVLPWAELFNAFGVGARDLSLVQEDNAPDLIWHSVLSLLRKHVATQKILAYVGDGIV